MVMQTSDKDGNRGREGAQQKLCVRGHDAARNVSAQGRTKERPDVSVLSPSDFLLESPLEKPNQGPRARMHSKRDRPWGSCPGVQSREIMDLGGL